MPKRSIDVRAIYDADYFTHQVDGCSEFGQFDGSWKSLFYRYRRNIELIDLKPSESLLEIGCGRGEICIFHALTGGIAKGVDFSEEAIEMAKDKAAALGASVQFVAQSFGELSEPAGSYDVIIASEFIEHVSTDEGREFIRIAARILKPGGRILIYTYPNTLQRRYGYPLLRLYGWLNGQPLPAIQEDAQSEHYSLYHLNEQSFLSLRALARTGGFRRYRAGYDSEECSGLKRIVMRSPLRHIFDKNLYLIAEK